jgi:alpha-ketoglutarate-dependent taurine dioxygenase
MTAITVTPLTTTIAAEIDGVDLRKPIAQEAAETIRKALATHSVIVFHNQHIDLEQHKAVASIFGPLEPYPSHKFLGHTESVSIIDNKKFEISASEQLPNAFTLKDEFQEWHTGATYCAQIPVISCIRNEVISPVGGATTWTNAAAAYEALSPKMQDWLEGVNGVHVSPPGLRATLSLSTFPTEVQEGWEKNFAARLHPVVVRHPVTGRKILFVTPVFCVKIDKLSNSESAMLLRFLFNHLTKPDFVYRHKWKEGDLVIWDELATAHLAPKDFAPHHRRVVRVSAGLVTPTAARAEGNPPLRQAS